MCVRVCSYQENTTKQNKTDTISFLKLKKKGEIILNSDNSKKVKNGILLPLRNTGFGDQSADIS